MAKFIDFDEAEKRRTLEGESEEVIRVPLPKKNELMGVVEKLLGNARR